MASSPDKELRVLIVAASDSDGAILIEELRKGGYAPVHERVDTRTAMAAALARQPWDLVITDYALPRFNAMMALTLLKKTAQDLPCIVVSSSLGEELAVAALKMGAHDYILKG